MSFSVIMDQSQRGAFLSLADVDYSLRSCNQCYVCVLYLTSMKNEKPTNWWSRQNAAPLKFNPEAAFRPLLSNFDECRPEVADDAIPGATVESVGMSV